MHVARITLLISSSLLLTGCPTLPVQSLPPMALPIEGVYRHPRFGHDVSRASRSISARPNPQCCPFAKRCGPSNTASPLRTIRAALLLRPSRSSWAHWHGQRETSSESIWETWGTPHWNASERISVLRSDLPTTGALSLPFFLQRFPIPVVAVITLAVTPADRLWEPERWPDAATETSG